MLDLLPPISDGPKTQIPMDLSQYLLSASPPASEFSLMGYSSHSHSYIGLQELGSPAPNIHTSNCPFHQPLPFIQPDNSESYNSITNINKAYRRNSSHKRNSPLKSIIMKSDSIGTSSDSEMNVNECPISSSSDLHGKSPKKKVSFADNKGLSLTEVRLLKESPDEPPKLNFNILSSLTLGANADVTSKPPIKLCFAQPASDYLAFRDKIQNNFVSLENVILRDYTAEGTIKVRNIAFEKRVFVRLSIDEWASFEDHDAVFVPNYGAGSIEPYDTFSFRMEISPSFDVNKKVQFAVCFSENEHEHWDNNGGENYSIMSEDNGSVLQDHGLSYHERWLPSKSTDSWSEFSVWRDLDSGGPYY